MEELIDSQSDVVGRLAFKYMEMCKVDSSSDSESESNPRWSDVSSKGCDSSDAPQKLQRFTGPSYRQCLDPYDGSSEDSGSSAEGSKQQRLVGFRVNGTGFRSAAGEARTRTAAADVQMRSSSDSEPETLNQGFCPCKTPTSVKADLSDSGFNTRSSRSSPAAPSARDTGSPDGAAFRAAFPKRKLCPPPSDADDGMRRKRRCVSDMEAF